MRQPVSIPKRAPWVTQARVVRALISQQAAKRYGEYRLGMFWMLMEPLVGVLVVGTIIGPIVGRSMPEIPYPFFVLNGMLLLKLLTGSMNSGISAINAGHNLLVYPTVKPLDPILARMMLEFLTTIFAFVVFCIASSWLGVDFSLGNLDTLAASYLLTWFIGCGLGLIFGIIAFHYNEFEKVVPVLQRPLLFVSAVMFPMYTLPESTKQILLWNPLVHTIELSRKSLFPFYHAEGAELLYATYFAIIVTSIGLSLFHLNRHLLSQR
jgi:capsular polysaccharide transport system permease protein